MRIIAGAAKGRRIYAPPGVATRPTADRVREALFSVLAPYIAGAKVLDAFAGSGALGLESLSRGAASAVFIEKAPAALKILRRNVELCSLPGAEIKAGDSLRFLAAAQNLRFDLIFLDPPYQTDLLEQALAAVLAGVALADDGIIVAESAARRQLVLPPGLSCFKHGVYGDTALHYLQYAK